MDTTIALVGRPNVGKSRLFNRLIGKRRSIVHNLPGVTRDVIVEDLHNGLILMDTGGIGLTPEPNLDVITNAVEVQVNFAIEAADLIFFVVDGRAELTALDYEIAKHLRKSGKSTVLVVNKIDSPNELHRCDAFHKLGFKQLVAVSAEHGYGEENLNTILAPYAQEKRNTVVENTIKFCLAGRPNVGKSSLANALTNSHAFIESPVPGTTRDTVHYKFQSSFDSREYLLKLIDTAGLRAKKKIDSSVEFFSTLRTNDAIDSADIVVYVIDALTGVTRQDKKLINQLIDREKACILAVNKWDLAQQGVKKSYINDSILDFQKKFKEAIQKELPETNQIPIIFTSAKNGYSLKLLQNEIISLYIRLSQSLSTGKINRTIQTLIEHQPPTFVSGKRFKIYYAVQCGHFPLKFKIFCNQLRRLTAPYKRYLEKGIRQTFALFGCPIRFEFVSKTPRYAEKTP